MDGWYICPLNACAGAFFLQKKTLLFRLDPSFFRYYNIIAENTVLVYKLQGFCYYQQTSRYI